MRWLPFDQNVPVATLADDPTRPFPLAALGLMLLNAREPDAARTVLENYLMLPEAPQNAASVVGALNTLAACYQRLLRFDEAEAAYAKSVEIADATLDPGHRARVAALVSWASVERGRGALDQERQLWQQVLPALQRDPELANQLAGCLQSLHELDTLGPEEQRRRDAFEAARAADQAMSGTLAARVSSFEAAQNAAGALADLLGGMGRRRERIEAIRDGLIMRPEEMWLRLTATGAIGRQPVLDEQRCRFNLLLGKVLQDVRPETAHTAFETLVWRRGIGLEIYRCANRLARQDAGVRERLRAIQSKRAHYAADVLAGPPDVEMRPDGGVAAVREPIDRDAEYQAMERQLLDRLTPDVNRFVSHPAGCAELASRIPADGLLIEFWRLTTPGGGGEVAASYVALVMLANRPDTASVVNLCPCGAVEDVLLDYLAALSGRSRTADVEVDTRPARDPARARELGETIRALLLDPLLPWTTRAQHLLLVTDGLLSRLPFAALPADDGYVMDRWLVSYLHTSRDLFDDDDSPGPPGGRMVITAPSYDWPGSFGISPVRFEPLVYAWSEGKAVGDLLGVAPLSRNHATVTALAGCRSPEILHIITHAMLLPAQGTVAELGNVSPFVWRDAGEARLLIPGLAVLAGDLGRLSGLQLPDQALRSVLMLAGVNTWLANRPMPEDAGNGLLTAEDIAALDLHGTRLVVLSACETGLGVIGIGEGVVGLRSSFPIAGAETLVVSLWSVDDQSTKDLMCAFYQNLTEDGMGRAKALQEAQQAVRKQHPDDPFYWAPFLCQGATGPLRR